MNWNNGFSIAFLLCISMPQAFGQQQQQLLETRSRVDASDAIPLIAEDPQPGLFFAGPIPRTKFIADDASLNAVCAVGNKCWAVGERGVVLISEDGGQTWTTSIVSTDCCLQSVCFLTNQIGYVAGSQFDSINRRRRPVLMMTRNGGEIWQSLCQHNADSRTIEAGFTAAADLPPLTYVKYFDLEEAIAIGRGDSVEAVAKVFRTQDGGRRWQVVESDAGTATWTSGAFLSSTDGLVIGRGSALGTVVAQKLVALRRPQPGLQQIHSASLSLDGHGWLAGDAAYLQHSQDGGITWKPADAALPPHMTDVIDLRAVCHRENVVCAAGSPGSLALQSTDGGKSWAARKLPGSVPVSSLCMVGNSTVIAVGALGVVRRSTDGGNQWTAVRNADYRTSVLCLTTNPEDVSFRMLASICGNEGFRAVVAQPSARIARPGIDDALAADRMSSTLPQVGANVFVQDWMFSRTQPQQSTVAAELMKTWELQSDGRVGELLPQRLAELIRIWRPDVVSIERATESDQVAAIWSQALGTALRIAAGTDHRGQILDSVGLAQWTVGRVVMRQPERSASPLSFSDDTLLKNLGTVSSLVANHCHNQLLDAGDSVDAEDFRKPTTDFYAIQGTENKAAVPHLLAGMMVAPGSASRRMLTHAGAEHLDQLQRLTRQAQQQRAVLANHAQRMDTPLNLIAQLKSVGADLPDHLAMQQLLSLAQMYASVENLDGQIAVLKEITERFPDAAEAADANELLFQFYSSAELRFLRRKAGTSSVTSATESRGTESLIQQVAGSSIPGIAKPIVMRAGRGQGLSNPQGSDNAAVAFQWDRNADIALDNLRRLSSERASSPELLLRHAANLRLRKDENRSNTALSLAGQDDGTYALLARTEMQAVYGAASTAVPVINLKKAISKPFLDATLIDEIWEDAAEIPLATVSRTGLSTDPGCLVMLAWDDDHIYLSGRVDKVAGREYYNNKTLARNHDAGHGNLDRVEISFDTDRDYTTAFHFTIDESGQTSERCWKSRNWNPEWFVAADADETSWRFEIAIPQEELVSQPLTPGDLWAMRIYRIVPGVLQQSLKDPETETAPTEAVGHGLLRFIRRRN